jgi:hypothetical protein
MKFKCSEAEIVRYSERMDRLNLPYTIEMSDAVREFLGSLSSTNCSEIPVNLKYDTIISLVCEDALTANLDHKQEPSQPLSYGESDWLGCFQIAI